MKNVAWAGLVTLVVGAAVACGSASTSDGSGNGESVGRAQSAEDTLVDVVSPATCSDRAGRLYQCKIPTKVLSGTSFDSAVPLRTRITAVRSGTCTTSFPLEVGFDADGADEARLRILSATSTDVRRHDGAALSQITLKDVFQSTSLATIPDSCRVSLQIAWNQPDVDSKAAAQAILDAIQKDLTDKQTIRDRYKALTLYHRAFLFLDSIAQEFYTELTNDSIQQLRALGTGSMDALATIVGSCSGDVTPDDRQNLMTLIYSLPQLGTPDDWKNPDGGTKTLADLMGPSAGDVYATVKKMAEQAGAGPESDYDQAYKDSELAVAKAQTKLAMAQKQLASWLN